MMLETIQFIAAGAVEHGEATGPISELAGQFGVEWKFVVAQAINFVIVVFLLHKFAFKPVIATIEERQQKISDGLQYAEEMKSKLAEAEKKQADTLREAQHEAQKIITEARDRAKVFYDKQTQEAVARTEGMMDKARNAIELERQKMMSEVRKEVARLVVQTSIKVLDRELSDGERSAYSESAARELTSTNA